MDMDRLVVTDVRAILREDSNGLRMSARRLAQRLYSSETTLRRKLRAAGTSLTHERSLARAEIALPLLQRGKSVKRVADRVGISPDHLRVTLESIYGLHPSTVQHVGRLVRTLEGEPRSLRALERAQEKDRLLQDLLADIGPDHPLASWARNLILVGYHPERESAKYRERLRVQEREAYLRARDQRDAEVVMAMADEELPDVDVSALLTQKQESIAHMRMTANRRRRAGGQRGRGG